MDIIWRLTMVLLSTLAAFVIIVHTAEDDIALTYRRDLRSRDLDNSTTQYEQTWRVSEVDPIAQKMLEIPIDPWNNSSEEPPKRRRPGRKRKRRPQQQIPTEEVTTQIRYNNREEPQHTYVETNSRELQETAAPKRRRKKPNPGPNEWQSETTERQLRRRAHRRKRPTLNSWPELSEFNVPKPDDIRLGSVLDPSQITDERIYTDTEGIRQLIEQNHSENDGTEIKTERALIDFREQKTEEKQRIQEFKEPTSQLTSTREDKSLSEFSLELPDASKHSKIEDISFSQTDSSSEKVKDKSFGVISSFRKIQNKGAMDPVTLKDILKRSNGTSLSEILQQHNLSLTDLLSGKESAISVLNSHEEKSLESPQSRVNEYEISNKNIDKSVNNYNRINKEETDSKVENFFINLETKPVFVFENEMTTLPPQHADNDNESFVTTKNPDMTPKLITRRRLPGSRKRLRMRPMLNSTYNRNLPVLTPRHHIKHLQRNPIKVADSNESLVILLNKTKEFTLNRNKKVQNKVNDDVKIGDVTMQPIVDSISSQISVSNQISQEKTNTEIPTTLSNVDIAEIREAHISEKPVLLPRTRHPVNSSTLRQQPFSNRLKKQRQRHNNATTEIIEETMFKNLFEAPDVASSSEFIGRTKPAQVHNKQIKITLREYLTTKIPISTDNVENERSSSLGKTSTTTKVPHISSSTEDTARNEIEEIFNDIGTSARLTKILMERNMTLSELIAHRERGSSNIHLADIFHNTSKEPKSPVPFLSKSLIEPISKETYPLRALLDANVHEINTKTPSLDIGGRGYIDIPVVMDFGNNVNENAENMGIMTLFNNYTKHDENIIPNSVAENHKGVNNTDDLYKNDTRNGKMMTYNQNQDEIVSWNDVFTLMKKTYKNDTGTIPDTLKEGPIFIDPSKKPTLDEDIDGDGLIILEELQNLKDFDSKVPLGANEKIEVKTFERIEAATEVAGILDKIPSQTKSVTVATACIAGLAVILFLLTYAVFKWRQEKKSLQKRDVEGENIPTPVFENRKGHKNNSSMRSISPMLNTSNIYTLNTLNSRNGKDSPEYMWDTLQKPFQ